MSNAKYKNIGKKQIINVINQTIQKGEATEMTINLLLMKLDEDKILSQESFHAFMKEKLGGLDETQGNEESDGKEDSTTDTKDS